MTALLEGLKYNWLVCRKHEKIEKVTGSQDDDLVGVLKKNILNELAIMGRSPFERFCYVGKNTAAKNKDRCA